MIKQKFEKSIYIGGNGGGENVPDRKPGEGNDSTD